MELSLFSKKKENDDDSQDSDEESEAVDLQLRTKYN